MFTKLGILLPLRIFPNFLDNVIVFFEDNEGDTKDIFSPNSEAEKINKDRTQIYTYIHFLERTWDHWSISDKCIKIQIMHFVQAQCVSKTNTIFTVWYNLVPP